MEGITHRTLSGLFWVLSGAGFQAVLRMVVFVILARLLTPADFGLVNAASVVVGFSEIFSLLGIGPAVVQRPNLEERHIRTGFTISVLFGVLMAGFIWLLSLSLAGFFQMKELTPVIRVLVLAFPLHSISVIAESLLQRELQFRWLAGINVASFALGYGVVGVSLALTGFGVWALVGATLAQAVFNSTILLTVKPHPRLPQFDRRAFNELMYFGGGFTAARICNYIALQGDYLVVGRWLGAEALGLYGRAYQLMVLPATILGKTLDRVFFPVLAKVQEDPKRLAMVYRRSVSLIALLILPTSAAMLVLGPEIIYVLLGSKWTGAIVPFQILTIGMLFRTSYKVSDSLSQATGKVYHRAWLQSIYAALVLGGAWVGQHWGISGVALGVLGAIAINFILMAQLSLSVTSMTWESFLAVHLSAMLLATLIYMEVWLLAIVMRNLAMPAIVILIISILVTAITLLLLLRLMPKFLLGKEGVWMLDTIGKYWRKRTDFN